MYVLTIILEIHLSDIPSLARDKIALFGKKKKNKLTTAMKKNHINFH